MLSRLRDIRLSWPQIALIAAASALSTAVIIRATTGGQGLPSSTLAALHQRVAVHTVASQPTVRSPVSAPARSAPASVGTVPITDSATPAPAPPPATPATPAQSTTTSSGAAGTGTTGGDTTAGSSTSTSASSAHPVAHVFVIALSTPSYQAAFGPGSVAHYLNRTLRRRGTLLSGYRTLGGSELPDYLAMVSGQAPNGDTRTGCSTYAEFAASSTPLASGQVPGRGCIYPNTVLTIADQVTAAGKQWRAYLADMGSSTCVHPDSNAADDGQLPGVGAQYDTRHNPFIYFHSLLDLGGCSTDDVGAEHLAGALRTAARTPNYVFVAPGACDEPPTSTCPGGKPGGLAGEDAFLKRWVPAIIASPAYKQNGVLMIVFAKAPATTASRPVRTGALILSPQAKAGRTVSATYGPYSVLHTIDDLFGYSPLVHAKTAPSFAKSVLTGA